MFKCSKCEAHESEVHFLREQIKALTDRLVAISSPYAYQAVHQPQIDLSQFYGGDDEVIEYAANGQKVIVTKQAN